MALIAWYPLTENLNDYSGNNISFQGTSSGYDNNGKIGKAIKLIKSGDKLIFGQNFQYSKMSFCFWIKTNTTQSSYESLLSDNKTNKHYLLIKNGSNTIGYWNSGFKSFDINIPRNVFTHISVTYDNISKKTSLYINGEFKKTIDLNLDMLTFPIKAFGNWESGNYFSGLFNDVRVYDHVLSLKEISEISKGKMLHYKFNDDMEEPTTNLYPNNLTPLELISNTDNDNIKQIVTKISDGHYRVRLEKKTNGNTWPNIKYPNYTFEVNKKYSMSIDIKVLEKVGSANIELRHSSISNDYSTSGRQAILISSVTPWTRYKLVRSFTSTVIQSETTYNTSPKIEIYANMHKVGDIIEFEFKRAQIERKDNSTPFTKDTRISKVGDCSGLRNHAAINAITSPSWNNDSVMGNGSFKFDGSIKMSDGNYQHIKSLNTIRIPEEGTISYYIKHSGTENGDNKYAVGFSHFCSMNNNNIMGLIYYHESSNYTTRTCTKQLRDGKWHLYTITWSSISNNIKFYADGIIVSTVIPGAMYHVGSFRNFLVGNAWGTNYGGHSGTLDDIRLYATQLSDKDISELYNIKGSISKNGNLFIDEIFEQSNLFNENMILSRQSEIKVNNNSKLIKKDNRYCIAISASSFYSNSTGHSIFESNYFKSNTSYIFDLTINGHLIYQEKEVPCGFKIKFTDGTYNQTFVISTSGKWKNYKFVSPSNKSIEKVEVYYYIADLFYVDLNRSFICESKNSNVDRYGKLNTNEINEIDNTDNIFKMFKNGTCSANEFIEN